MLSELSGREGASDVRKSDYRKIYEFLGAKDGEELTREQKETWARGLKLNPMLNFGQRSMQTYKNATSRKDIDKTELGIDALQVAGEVKGIPGTDQAAHTGG